jgi:putative FmdB family regulatory protein
MPLYTYRCSKCKSEIEELQKMGDAPPERCPECGAENTLERTMGVSNFQLKGGGWAKDGYG